MSFRFASIVGWLFLPLMIAALRLSACDGPIDSIYFQVGSTQRPPFRVDTVASRKLPAIVDTTRYYALEVGTSGSDLDFQRMDSLARWLHNSGFGPAEIWVPLDPELCLRPVLAPKYFTVRFRVPPPGHLEQSGFHPTNQFDRCFTQWRHYIFSRQLPGN